MNVKLITISFLLIGFVVACDKKDARHPQAQQCLLCQ